jgi:chromosome segregation ATPase
MGSEHGIPEDFRRPLLRLNANLREHYEECGKYQNAHTILCRQLIENIAALEERVAELTTKHNEQFIAASQLADSVVRLTDERNDLRAQIAVLSNPKPQNLTHARLAIRAARIAAQKSTEVNDGE